MDHVDIETVEDARAWIREQRTITREDLHVLQLQFREHAVELAELIGQLGIEMTGQPGM